MYSPQQVMQLDPATQALAQAVSVLKQRANPTAPNGQPSIAGQAMQAAQAQMQPQMPPQGIMQLPPQGGQPQQPGIAGIAQNAATGAAIQQMQEQQQQQALMELAKQQQAQQQPQMMAEGGVAGLSAGNMGFREGGIIPTVGYAGGGKAVDPYAINVEYGEGIEPTFGIMGALPAEPENPEVAEQRRLMAERMALDRQRIPELYSRGTEAVSSARSEMEAAQQQALKERGMERLMAVLSAGAQSRFGAGQGYLDFQNASRKADALYAQQKQLLAMQQLEQDKLRYSYETGSNSAAAEATKNIAGIKDKLADNAFQIKQLAETARGNDLRAAENQADREARIREGQADRASRERTASLGLDRAEKAQNLRQYLDAMNAPDMKKLGESVAAAEKRGSSDAPALRKQLNEKRASYAKYYKLTPQEAASAFEDAGASTTGAAGVAELKYNPKTGKIE